MNLHLDSFLEAPTEINPVFATMVGAGCAYEVLALTTGRVPTISSLCRHHRTIEAALLAMLFVHLHRVESLLADAAESPE